MKKFILLQIFVLISYSLFSQETDAPVKPANDHNFEIMLGAAVGTDNTSRLTARAVFSDYMSDNLMIGAGIEYFRIGMSTYDDIVSGKKDKSYFATMKNGVSFLVDLRVVCPLGDKASFLCVVDGGIFAAERGYERFGFQIGLQPGFRFRLNERGSLALNIRPSYKYMTGAKSNVIGLMLGLSF